jgi:hypothetical protein
VLSRYLITKTRNRLIVGAVGIAFGFASGASPPWTRPLVLVPFLFLPAFMASWEAHLRRTKFKVKLARDIALFRPFNKLYAVAARAELFPVLGCYGHVRGIRDRTLALAERTLSENPDDGLGEEDVSDAEATRGSTDARWRARAEELMATSDVLVFDVSIDTPQIRDELDMAIRMKLAPDRALLVAHEDADWGGLCEHYGDRLPTPLIYGDPRVLRLAFRRQVYRWFRTLTA